MAISDEQKREELVATLRGGLDKLTLAQLVTFIRNPTYAQTKTYILNKIDELIDEAQELKDFYTELKQEAEKL